MAATWKAVRGESDPVSESIPSILICSYSVAHKTCAPRDPWTSPSRFSAALRSRAGPVGELGPLLDVLAAVGAGEDTTWSSSQRARRATPTSSPSRLAAKFQLWENTCTRGFRATLPGMVDGDKHAGLGRKHGLRGAGGCG
jgi:hypothetical protein